MDTTKSPAAMFFLDDYFVKVPISLAGHMSTLEAMIISKIYYWVKKYEEEYKKNGNHKDHIHDGHMWVFNTYKSWRDQIPFYSVKTIERNITKLRKKGFILVDRFNKLRKDRTRWYTINDKGFEVLINKICARSAIPGQSVYMDEDKMSSPLPIEYIHKTSVNNRLAKANQVTNSFFSSSDQVSNQNTSAIQSSTAPAHSSTLQCLNEQEVRGWEIFDMYVDTYQDVMGKKHPFITKEQVDRGIEVITQYFKTTQHDISDSLSEMIMIDLERARRLGNSDGNFNAFANFKVLELLQKEVEI